MSYRHWRVTHRLLKRRGPTHIWAIHVTACHEPTRERIENWWREFNDTYVVPEKGFAVEEILASQVRSDYIIDTLEEEDK